MLMRSHRSTRIANILGLFAVAGLAIACSASAPSLSRIEQLGEDGRWYEALAMAEALQSAGGGNTAQDRTALSTLRALALAHCDRGGDALSLATSLAREGLLDVDGATRIAQALIDEEYEKLGFELLVRCARTNPSQIGGLRTAYGEFRDAHLRTASERRWARPEFDDYGCLSLYDFPRVPHFDERLVRSTKPPTDSRMRTGYERPPNEAR